MNTTTAPTRLRYIAWLNPSWVSFLGAAAVMLLLLMPISALGPGDHEEKNCGNALALNLQAWRVAPSEEARGYWETAFRSCTSQRVDRLAQALGVVSVTILIVTFRMTQIRRRNSLDDLHS